MDPTAAIRLAVNIIDIDKFTAELVQQSCRAIHSTTGNAPAWDNTICLSKQQQATCARILSNGVVLRQDRYNEAIESQAIKAQAAHESSSQTSITATRRVGRAKSQADLEVFAKATAEDSLKMLDVLDGLAVKSQDNGKTSYGAALRGIIRARSKEKEAEEYGQLLDRHDTTMKDHISELDRLEKQLDSAGVRQLALDSAQHIRLVQDDGECSSNIHYQSSLDVKEPTRESRALYRDMLPQLKEDSGCNDEYDMGTARTTIRGLHVRGQGSSTAVSVARLAYILYQSVARCRFLDAILEDFATSAPHDMLTPQVYLRIDETAAAFMRYCVCGMHNSRNVVDMLVRRNQFQYATAVLRLHPQIARQDFESPRKPFLSAALGMHLYSRKCDLNQVQLDFLEAYLDSGVDVNHRDEVDDRTALEWIVGDWHAGSQVSTIANSVKAWQVAKIFLQHNARLDGTVGGIQIKRLLEDLIPIQHLPELYELVAQRDFLDARATSTPRPLPKQIPISTAIPGSVQRHGSTRWTREGQVSIDFKPELTPDEVEAYYQRTGFRPWCQLPTTPGLQKLAGIVVASPTRFEAPPSLYL